MNHVCKSLPRQYKSPRLSGNLIITCNDFTFAFFSARGSILKSSWSSQVVMMLSVSTVVVMSMMMVMVMMKMVLE